MNAKIDALQELTATVNDQRISVLEKENKAMKTAIKTLALQQDNNQQKAISTKLQINDVPSMADENLIEIVIQIAANIGVTLSIV